MQWSDDDRAQIAAQGTSVEEVERQLELFRRPPPALEIDRPCAIGDGIRALDAAALEDCAAAGRRAQASGRVTKFVPASGAASRMFQALLQARESGAAASLEETRRRAAAGDEAAAALLRFVEGLPRFAFAGDLRASLAAAGLDLDDLVGRGSLVPVLDHLLTAAGLDYAALPKGLLAFHRYPEGCRTPFEEHLVEAAAYARDADGACRAHFTVSPEHRPGFSAVLERSRPFFERRHRARFEVAFSAQKPATDTIAVDLENRPFRSAGGRLLFRPGGHGALLDNLADLDADIVSIKNIDNVVPEHLAAPTVLWKQALIGVLAGLQAEIFRHLEALEVGGGAAAVAAAAFAARELGLAVPGDPGEARELLRRELDRPLRVCGVVRNSGEPGGGPFWVRDPGGGASLQIVESAQVDRGSAEQRRLFESSTHFNPVDLVCGLRDRHGRPFALADFTDPGAVFIATKSSGGRELKALERPGLWNGAMARWRTVFVEVPLETFNPVKTVLDLLRPEHQPAEP